MKYILTLLFFSVYTLIGCNKNNIIEEDKFKNILIEIILINQMKENAQDVLQENNILPRQYIMDKFKIDSISLEKTINYYSEDLRKFKEITKKAVEEIRKKKEKIDTLDIPTLEALKEEPFHEINITH